jgi:hypothetical protein
MGAEGGFVLLHIMLIQHTKSPEFVPRNKLEMMSV